MRKLSVILATFFWACAVLPAAAAPAVPSKLPSLPSSFVVAESEGVGMTRGEALMDARRNAVQQAIGLVSKGVTQVIDERIRENVLQLSRGFIEKYELLAERQETGVQRAPKGSGLWRVKIKTWIRKENLLAGLLQKDPDKSVLDGAGLITRALSREQQIAEAAEMLIETLTSIPYENYVHTAVGAEKLNAAKGELTLDVRFSFDRERYFNQMAPLCNAILDYIAESKQKNVPFLLNVEPGDPVLVTPPSGMDALSQYMALMEIKGENRYIDIPEGGGFANIYLLTGNYYFDCYRVPAEAFALLMENLLQAERQGRLTGKIFDEADLKIAFKNKSGQLIHEHVEPLQLYNVMLFVDLAGLKRSPYVKGKQNQLDEQRHALFILPRLGTIQDDAADYLLLEGDTASISVKLSPQDIRLVERAECRVEMKRKQ
ncbi:MAG: hypothetical protein LBQ42_13830 [Synergistaceae bacterium]|jgi:hypothetical protein|nr:hypothetical protein [Synergistaceae bacterium]